jgi:hypothetical protein
MTSPPLLTDTWRHRLTQTGSLGRRTATAIGFTACTLVALHIIWVWFTDTPIDVTTPARAVVNRTEYIAGYAKTCMTLLLTTTETQRGALADCWSPDDLHTLPTTAPVLVDATDIAKITPVDTYPNAEQWQVIVRVTARPYPSATPTITLHQINVLFSAYGLRAVGLPATVNDGGTGATLPLAYGTTLPVGAPIATGGNRPTTNPVSDTVAGFLTTYLTATTGLDRYAAATSGLLPVTTCRTATLTALLATHTGAADTTTPPDGTTVRVLATVTETTTDYTPRTEQYPLTLTVTGGRWSVTRIDPGPLLTPTADLTPVQPAPTGTP